MHDTKANEEKKNLGEKARDFAAQKHGRQTRKGTDIPYIEHPEAVARCVASRGGSEEQVAAAFLHDVIEDCGVSQEQLREAFGPDVARMVAECSDWNGRGRKPAWEERKKRYIEQLREAGDGTLLVSICDKLHNATAIVEDVKEQGARVWNRFSAAPDRILWYYGSLLQVFRSRCFQAEKRWGAGFEKCLDELERTVEEMRRLTRLTGSD